MPAITLVVAIPPFVSQEEYNTLIASTPNSFNDLPAVLKHKEDDVSVKIDPSLEGFSEEDAAKGTLYVLTSYLIFASTTGRNFQIEYPSITLHAIQRTDRSSIYCQLDEIEEPPASASNGETLNGGGDTEEGDDAEEQGYAEMRELNITPSSVGTLDTIFEALSYCASLHPDKFDDEEGMDDGVMMADDNSPFEFFTGDGDEELSEVGKAALAHLESIVYDPFHPKEEEDAAANEEETSAKPKQ
ncbi:hypothetical protein FA13DRAFT_1763140 [Coprinellus micaceus]|uniref:Regulator of volume decrease after cellular swelling-domain-containing protein n=1 Tax=Coprinellus micaceus TaxID=71717 RepID=A0A4Y7TKN0_COPMI|nr:hypothetical protein FA13DRAFT_1763140 [Coprinellus micaceus]